jgi:hypothetical protein
MLKDLYKHASEFRRALANYAYELIPGGIRFNRSGFEMRGLFEMQTRSLADRLAGAEWSDMPWVHGHNRVVDQGINHILNTAIGGATQITTYYMAPFATNTTPGASLTAATFNSVLTEFTNYDETPRQTYVPVAATAKELENSASPVLITIADGVQTDIYGWGLLTVSTKSATTGVLVAAALLATPKTGLGDGDEARGRYKLVGSSS